MSEFKGWDIVITNELGATLKTIENRYLDQVNMFLESVEGTNIFGYIIRKNINSKHVVKITFQEYKDVNSRYNSLLKTDTIPNLLDDLKVIINEAKI